MKKQLVSILLLGAVTAHGAENNGIDHFRQMNTEVRLFAFEEFMSSIRANKWEMPRIPSKWHIENHAKDDAEKQRLEAAREFGVHLAHRLEELARDQVGIRPHDALYERSLLLCDLGDWCATPVGYGNFLIARECLVLASVGLNRLTADLDFPLEKCVKLAARLNPKWLGTQRVLQIWNDEAGAKIFIITKGLSAQLAQDLWLHGMARRDMLENPELSKFYDDHPLPSLDAKLVDVKVFMDHLHFFARIEKDWDASPFAPSLLQSLNLRQHEWLLTLATTQRWRDNAQALLKYRSAVGLFPLPYVWNEEDIKHFEKEKEVAEKNGLILLNPVDKPSYDPLEEAFRREAMKKDSETGGDKNFLIYEAAFRAYKMATTNPADFLRNRMD